MAISLDTGSDQMQRRTQRNAKDPAAAQILGPLILKCENNLTAVEVKLSAFITGRLGVSLNFNDS